MKEFADANTITAGVEFIWGDLTPPIYVIGPHDHIDSRGAIGRLLKEKADNEVLQKVLKEYLLVGAFGFIADMSALAFIKLALSLIHGFQNVHYVSSTKFAAMTKPEKLRIYKSEVVCIAGPYANAFYKEMIGKYSDIDVFLPEDKRQSEEPIIIENDTDLFHHDWLDDPIILPKGRYKIEQGIKLRNKYFPTITSLDSPAIYQDCGVLLKRPNVYNDKRSIYFIAGLRSPGTQAAGAISLTEAMSKLHQYVVDNQISNDIFDISVRIRGNGISVKPDEESIIKMIYPVESQEYSNITSLDEAADGLVKRKLEVIKSKSSWTETEPLTNFGLFVAIGLVIAGIVSKNSYMWIMGLILLVGSIAHLLEIRVE